MERESSNPGYESFIKRTTPEVPIQFVAEGEYHRIKLRYDNTIIYTHHEDYKQFDHIFVYGHGLPNEGVAIFRDPDGDFAFAEKLLEMGYDSYDRYYPAVEDEERWFEWQTRDIDDILD